MWAGDYAQELSANKLLATLVFAVCIHTLQTAKPAEASADAAYPLGEPTIVLALQIRTMHTCRLSTGTIRN